MGSIERKIQNYNRLLQGDLDVMRQHFLEKLENLYESEKLNLKTVQVTGINKTVQGLETKKGDVGGIAKRLGNKWESRMKEEETKTDLHEPGQTSDLATESDSDMYIGCSDKEQPSASTNTVGHDAAPTGVKRNNQSDISSQEEIKKQRRDELEAKLPDIRKKINKNQKQKPQPRKTRPDFEEKPPRDVRRAQNRSNRYNTNKTTTPTKTKPTTTIPTRRTTTKTITQEQSKPYDEAMGDLNLSPLPSSSPASSSTSTSCLDENYEADIPTGQVYGIFQKSDEAKRATAQTEESNTNSTVTEPAQTNQPIKKIRELKVGSLNVNSLKTRLAKLPSVVKQYDILFVSEVKLSDKDAEHVSVQGYKYYNNERKVTNKKISGGVGAFIKNDIDSDCSCFKPLDTDDFLWIHIPADNTECDKEIVLVNVYIPPKTKLYENFEREIKELCSNYEYVYLIGDFNARICSKENNKQKSDHRSSKTRDIDIEKFRNSKDNITKTTEQGDKLLKTCDSNKLIILNGRYGKDKNIGELTYTTGSVIDYALSSLKGYSLLKDFEVIKMNSDYSDGHALLALTLNLMHTVRQRQCKPKFA